MKYRERLLSSGVQVYELQPEPALRRQRLAPVGADSRVGLHAKAMVVDPRSVSVGSYSFNKAGALLSTETVLVISSWELAAQVGAVIDDAMLPGNSWRVELENRGKPGNPSLVWIGSRDGREVRLTSEPDTGFWRRLSIGFYWLLPLKERI